MSQDKMQILNMLEDGKIDTEEAERLLEALKEVEVDDSVAEEGEKKSLNILISEAGEEKINLDLPLGLARGLVGFIPDEAKEKLAEANVNLEKVLAGSDLSKGQELVRIEDEGDKVIITVE